MWALLAGALAYARVLTAENPPLDWPEIVIIVIVSAAVTVGVAFPLTIGIVEGLPMVLAKLYTDRVRAEALEEGRDEGSPGGRAADAGPLAGMEPPPSRPAVQRTGAGF